MLVGRAAHLQAGVDALESTIAGRGRLLLLTGEAGIGKTTLAREVADRAAAAGAVVRTGACWETEQLPPFTPWLDALRWPGGDPCAAAGEGLEGSRGLDARDPADALRARGRRFSDVVDALRVCAAERPQVVVLEDLHWADRESLELLVAVAAHLPVMRVLVIGTYRDDELSPGGLDSVGGNADRVPLTGLDDHDVATVLEAVLGRAPTERELVAIHRQTGGNPLFVTQMARLLGDADAGAVPAGVRDVLARRLARMSSSCDALLGAAAVLGTEFDQGVLEALVGSEVSTQLDEAAAARLVELADDVPGRWRFAHALLQATRYERLGTAERSRLHRAAVGALQLLGTASPSTLAHHAARADFAPDDPLPASVQVAAGHEALGRFAWSGALAAFERALQLAPPGDAATTHRAEAWLGIGAARLRQGRGDARGAFDEVAALGRRAGLPDLIARAALGFSVGLGAFEVRLLDHHQIELLEEAATVLGDGDPLLPLVLARLSVALAFVDSEERRAELARRAIDLARAADDPVVLGHALAAWCDALADPLHIEERLVAAGEAVVLGERAGDLPLELLGRRLRIVALLEQGRHEQTIAEIGAYDRAATALGDPLYGWYAALWRAALAWADGRGAEARHLIGEASDLGALGGSANGLLLVAVHELMAATDSRDRPAAEAAMATVLQLAPGLISPYADITTSYIEVTLGDLDRARLILGDLSPERVDNLPRDSEWLPALAQLAYAAARTGALDLARYVREQLRPLADSVPVEGIGAYLHGSSHRFLALVAAAEGDAEAARGHVAAARAAVTGGGRLLEALADLDGAWALRQSGEPSDLDASVVLARRAAAAFARSDLYVLASEADALSDAPTPDAVPAVPPDPGSAILRRLGDSWAWSWEGRTVHVRHAKGIADLARLLERPGREVHVRELDGAAAGARAPSQRALDATAVEQYKARLRDLEDDLDEADRHADLARATALTAERDALVAELTKAFGLSGRSRSVASDPDERLRKAVSARVRASIDRIEKLDARLGRHLRASIRTGFWCAYEPEHPVAWTITGP